MWFICATIIKLLWMSLIHIGPVARLHGCYVFFSIPPLFPLPLPPLRIQFVQSHLAPTLLHVLTSPSSLPPWSPLYVKVGSLRKVDTCPDKRATCQMVFLKASTWQKKDGTNVGSYGVKSAKGVAGWRKTRVQVVNVELRWRYNMCNRTK